MANRIATLIRYAKLPELGWRRGTLVKAKNGQYKPGVMVYNKQELDANNGVYQFARIRVRRLSTSASETTSQRHK
jgi:hypothetical protein